jgi:DNA-binding MarR family transcriptional regulator
MIISFDSYLYSHYSQKGQGHTHTRIGDANLSIKGGVYTIPNMPEFYQKYVKHVFEDGKFEFLTEKQHIEAGPLLIDFDFRYSTDIEEKQHTEENINDMVDLYFQDAFNVNDFNLTKNQWLLLKILIDADGRPQSELAFITNRDKASLTRLISVMEKKKLVTRISSKEDKRIKHIYITKKGASTFKETLPVVTKVLDTMQEGLTLNEVENAIKIMQKIQSNISSNSNRCLNK